MKTLSEDHEDFPSLYHGLGYINYVRANYIEALKYDRIAYEIRKQNLPENHLDIARSSLNLGCDYVRSGNHKAAMELLLEAFRIREEHYGGQDHVNIAIVCAAIGDNCIHLYDFNKALYFLTRALEMFKRVLPSEHIKISSVLMKIGYLWEKQEFYDLALQWYLKGHSMAMKTMPPEHPTLQKYFERIIRFYERLGRIDQGIAFGNEKVSTQLALVSEFHVSVAQIYFTLGDLNIDIEKKLFCYHKALNIWEKSK